MSIRNDVLGGKLDRLLHRNSPPRGMDPQAQADETAALMRAIDRHAPRSDYEGWWSRFEDALLEGLTTRAWPTVGDIAKAAAKVPQPKTSIAGQEHDWREFAARHQLRKWADEGEPCPPQFITKSRLYNLGYDSAKVNRLLTFAADPANQGVFRDRP